MADGAQHIDAETVRADFNDPNTVIHYTRAAHFLGLWKSEDLIIRKFFSDTREPLLEAGCGAGRATLGLHLMGFSDITAFDFAEELVEQARSLVAERRAGGIRVLHADATALQAVPRTEVSPSSESETGLLQPIPVPEGGFGGALFLFNGMMQIPGRANRRKALASIGALCRTGAPLIFTTHDREMSRTEHALWRLEALRWERGEQDPRLVEFGDRYFAHETGRTFMHLPDRREIQEDLAATGWTHRFDERRSELARESKAVRDFSDECRFWVALRGE